MESQYPSLLQAQKVFCVATAIICIFSLSFVLVKVNKRIPPIFFINILLYTLAIVSRAVIELWKYDKNEIKPAVIITSIAVNLVELSLCYFIFLIWIFKT